MKKRMNLMKRAKRGDAVIFSDGRKRLIMKGLYLISLVVVFVSGLIFAGYRTPASAEPPIKIGVLYPLTGPVAMTGELLVRGAKFGFEEAGYEVAGRKIEVIVEDSAALPAMAVDKARKLVEFDKVCMIIGPLVAGTKLAVGAYMSKIGVPHIVSPSCSWEQTEYGWSIMVGPSEPQVSYPMGLYAYDKMGLRTITVMAPDVVEGHGFLGAFMRAFKKRGGEVIQEQYSPFPCPDFAPYLAVLKDADAVVAWHHGADSVRFLTQFHEFGIRQRMPLVAAYAGNFFNAFIVNKLPLEAAKAVIGERCSIPWTPLLGSDVNKRFVQAFKKRHGYTPDVESEVYTAVRVILRALEATGGDTTREKLRQAILAVELEAPQGPIRFDPETRFVIRNIYICKVGRIGQEYVLVPVFTYKAVPPRGH